MSSKFDDILISLRELLASDRISMSLKNTPAAQQQQDVFTFVTVYYKHGEWGTEIYNTLRKGLLKLVDSTAPESEKESLALLDDEQLADRLLEIGAVFISGYIWKGNAD